MMALDCAFHVAQPRSAHLSAIVQNSDRTSGAGGRFNWFRGVVGL